MKRILGTVLALVLLTGSCAFADSAVDVILNTGTTQAFTDEAVPAASSVKAWVVPVFRITGTTQAFTDEAVPAADLETILKEGRVFSDDVAERHEP